jgi:DNA-binding transcriptional LysR family regulator
MELRQLRYFLTVAESLNFRRAAEQLHMTEPPLSRQVRQLEEELGIELFLRGHRQVRLTASGLVLQQKAMALLADTAGVVEAVRRTNPEPAGTLNVGVGMGLVRSIQQLAAAYIRQFPKVAVRYYDLYGRNQKNALRLRSIDVGIVCSPVDQVHLASQWLFNAPLLVLISKNSPLARRKKLRLTDLGNQVLLMPNRSQTVNQKVLQMFRQAGVALKAVHTTSSPFEAGAMWVTAGKGIYVLTGMARDFTVFNPGIAVVPLADPYCIEVYMAWRKDENSVAVLNFLEIAQKVFPRTL